MSMLAGLRVATSYREEGGSVLFAFQKLLPHSVTASLGLQHTAQEQAPSSLRRLFKALLQVCWAVRTACVEFAAALSTSSSQLAERPWRKETVLVTDARGDTACYRRRDEGETASSRRLQGLLQTAGSQALQSVRFCQGCIPALDWREGGEGRKTGKERLKGGPSGPILQGRVPRLGRGLVGWCVLCAHPTLRPAEELQPSWKRDSNLPTAVTESTPGRVSGGQRPFSSGNA